MLRWMGIALLITSVHGVAQGQALPDPSTMEEDARLHFELGARAYGRGDFEVAAAEFEEAYRLSRRPELLHNTYLAYRDAQRGAEAAQALRRYLEAAPDAPNRARLERALRELEARAGAVAAAPSEQAAPTAGVPVGPIAVLTAGAVLEIAALVTGALALARHDELASRCPAQRCALAEGPALQSELWALSITTDVLWPLGVAALAVGAIWLGVELSASPSGEASALGLSCGAGGCMARLEGSFQ